MENQTIEQLEIIIRAKVDDAIKGITTLTDAIKKKVAESTKPVQNLADKTREISNASSSSTHSANTSFIKYKNTIKQATAQQELLLRRIQDLKGTLNDIDLSKMLGSNEKLEMRAELEKLINQYNKLGNSGDKSSIKIKNSFENLWKSMKKGIFTLLSVESALSFVRKGISSAVNVNEDLQATQEITDNALGQIFVPLVEKAYVAVQYLTIGLARLIEMFSGVNILSKVTTKNIDKTGKSVKGLSKQLSSIDDIDVLSSDKGSLASGITSDLKALEEFQERVAKVDELFANWKIPEKVKAIKDAWNTYIQPILNWMSDNPETLETFFGIFLTGKLLKSINNVMGSASGKTGLLGMNNLLVGLGTTVFTINIVRKIIDEYGELHDSAIKGYHTGSIHKKNFLNQQQQAIENAIADGSIKTGILTEDFKNTMNEYGTAVTDNIDSVFDLINLDLNTLNANMTGTKDTINNLLVGLFDPTLHNESFDKLAEMADITTDIIDKIKLLVGNTELTDEQYKNIIDKLKIQKEHLENNLTYFEEGTDEWNKTNEAMKETSNLIHFIKYDIQGTEKPLKLYSTTWSGIATTVDNIKNTLDNTELSDKEYQRYIKELEFNKKYLEDILEKRNMNTSDQIHTEKTIENIDSLLNNIKNKNRDNASFVDRINDTADRIYKKMSSKINPELNRTNESLNDTSNKSNEVSEIIKSKITDSVEKFKEKIINIPDNISNVKNAISNLLQPALDKVKETKLDGEIENFKINLESAKNIIEDKLKPVTMNWLDNFRKAQKLNVDTTDANYKVGILNSDISKLFRSRTVDVKYNVDADTTKASNKLVELFKSKLTPSMAKLLHFDLPEFADGNVATSPTLAIFGEYGGAKNNPEVTAPQSVLKQTFTEVLATNNYNSNTEQRITIQLGTRELFDEFIDYVNDKTSNGVQVFKED